MAIAAFAGQQLEEQADLAWHQRWQFAWDMNADGMVTISDIKLWFAWVFFAPGDLLLLTAMQSFSPVALFLELTPGSLSGTLSTVVSAIAWLLIYGIVKAFAEGSRPPKSPPHS